MPDADAPGPDPITLFLCGDVMTGRGVDQVLPYSSRPRLYEPVITSASDYVRLAESVSGPIRRPVSFAYVWGDALDALARARPDASIINLETAVTTSEAAERKGINYRMHPGNVRVLTAAGIDCCVLANNHVLDWDRAGLRDTLDVLAGAGIATAGAGRDAEAARAPAALPVGTGAARVLVFAFGTTDAGVPPAWSAGPDRPGVAHLPDFTDATVGRIAADVRAAKRSDDIVVASIHWGGNWGYDVPGRHRRFAHALVERAGVDVVHGHSSHHPKAVEVHRDRLILYGCGDFLHDYEGIGGFEAFRNDLVLMYLPALERGTGRLVRLEMVPFQVRKFRLRRPADDDLAWVRETMDRECRRFGGRVVARDRALAMEWRG